MHCYVVTLAVVAGILGTYSAPLAAETDVPALEHMLDEWAVAWSSGNADNLMSLFTTDADYEDVTLSAVNHGPDALRKFATDAFEAFPGSTFELKSRFVGATGKWGAMEWVWRGRQTRDLPGLPATNAPFELRGSTVVEFRDGKISRNSDYWDLATFMKQVGLAK